MSQPTTLRELDVYRFSYNEAARAKMFVPHHCFDGQLIVRGGILVDTYWGLDPRGDHGRRFTLAEAEAKGTLTFVCNLSEVEKIPEYLYPQYADGDAFDISQQHGCYGHFVARKGAKKDPTKQLEILRERMKAAKHEATFAMTRAFDIIERSLEQQRRIEAGEEVTL